MRRYSPTERAAHRYFVRTYVAIFEQGFADLAAAAVRDYEDFQAAIQAMAQATADAAQRCVQEVIAAYIADKIIRQSVSTIPNDVKA